MRILVTGGAGFIGSVVTEQLVEGGHAVVVLDSLKHGFREAVHPDAAFVHGDILDQPLVERLLRDERIEAVAHLAGEIAVDESVRDPGLHYRANVVGGLSVLEGMARSGVGRIVFSSTAAVYGEPEKTPIAEDSPLAPCSPYGDTKLAFERMLDWYRTIHGMHYVSLRYFNACGATTRCGESRKRETHLIPIAIAAAMGQRNGLDLFGADYPTPDGTCVRDYIHVADIARAHLLALQAMDRFEARTYNLGNGEGYSNLEVIQMVKEVAGSDFPVRTRAAAAGRPSAAGGRRRPHPRGTRLEDGIPHAAADGRNRMAVAIGPSGGLLAMTAGNKHVSHKEPCTSAPLSRGRKLVDSRPTAAYSKVSRWARSGRDGAIAKQQLRTALADRPQGPFYLFRRAARDKLGAFRIGERRPRQVGIYATHGNGVRSRQPRWMSMNEPDEFVIAPAGRFAAVNWRELWRYRDLFWVFTWREISVRYKQTLLGVLWAIFQPLAMMVIFTFIFHNVAGVPSDAYGTPYPIFLFVGLLLWQYFSATLANASNSMVQNAAVIQKVYFPRLIIPASTAVMGLVDHGVRRPRAGRFDVPLWLLS